ncbi:MAG: DNA primase large subunit PriL [Thermoplasmata archaeon]|nr:MAG: DNA primase large subunit PriL [Thermoplasmata archaeon]
MDLPTLARYPFLSESAAYLREHGPSLEELLGDIAYERVRVLGKERTLEALEEGAILEHALTTDAERLTELLSYVVARILVSCVNDGYLTKRYALAEAKTTNVRLEGEGMDFVVGAAGQLGLDVTSENGVCRLQFIQFLRNTSQMRAKEWKIVNRDVRDGFVILNQKDLARVIQQALQMRIEGELPAEVNDEILKLLEGHISHIRKVVEEKKATFKARDFGKIRVTKLPPCIRTLLAKAQAGENLPHSGRFALTAFLRAIGMSADEIMGVFSASPDFDESKTRYQIDHITGEISGTVYSPPECSTMKSYGICFGEDGLCRKEWMTHPLKYYRVKDKSAKKKPVEKEDKAET